MGVAKFSEVKSPGFQALSDEFCKPVSGRDFSISEFLLLKTRFESTETGSMRRCLLVSQMKRAQLSVYSRVVKRTSMTIETGCSEEHIVRRASTKVVATSSALATTLQGMCRLSSSFGNTAPV